MTLKKLELEINKHSNLEKAKHLQRFFKTGKGEYGEGDVFLGITVPEQRKIAKHFLDLSIEEIQKLLNSKIHEKRLIGLLILVDNYSKGNMDNRKRIFDFYLKNARKVNNWDLVDLSCHKIVGAWLIDKDRKILYELAVSKNLWEKRISIISTFAFIRMGEFEDSLSIAEILLKDKHDLIQKAVGWMLREIGKKDEEVLEDFLKKHYKDMPRTMLRYAIERFEEGKRKSYLGGRFEEL